MSIERNSPYEEWKRNRGKVVDAVTPIGNKSLESKCEDNKLCPNCRRSYMEVYLQPPSRFIDSQGFDNFGFKPGHYYWKCRLLECNYRIEMPGQQQQDKGLLPRPNEDIKQPLFAFTKKRKNRRSDIQATEEDYQDFENFFGYRPRSVTLGYTQEG
jgi:hypothetical protein